jgi:hypothetical protein
MDHPISEDTLRRFLAGKAAREENRAVVAHLLQGCPSCSRALQALAGPPPESSDAYEAALDRLEKTLAASLDVPVTVEARPAARRPPGRSRHTASSLRPLPAAGGPCRW